MKDKVRIDLKEEHPDPAEQVGIAACTLVVMMFVIWVGAVVMGWI